MRPNNMTDLRLQLLGPFEARLGDGVPVAITGKKPKALLAYLALAGGQPVSRDRLAGVLWEFSADEQARTSLRQTLSSLRKCLAPLDREWLVSKGDTLAIKPEAVGVDALDFNALVADGTPEALLRATGLYRGELLEGLSLREEVFEDWLRTERLRLRERLLDIMSQLVAHHREAGDYEAGIEIAGRILAIDPLREDIHRELMVLYARAGRSDTAFKQFQECRSVLQHELAVQPASETQALYRTILEQRFAPENPEARTPGAAAAAPLREREDATPWHPNAALPLPAKPSIAVLPFDNMSGDPGLAYFSEGITEDIITELSRIRALFVISRRSSFAYRDSNASAQRIGQDLGVRYVVEGSVRKAANRVRVTAQLIDATTGNHVWAERYDRKFRDIFTVQEEVARIIVTTLAGRLDVAAETSVRARRADELKDCGRTADAGRRAGRWRRTAMRTISEAEARRRGGQGIRRHVAVGSWCCPGIDLNY